jgi:hypothetical protein
VELSDMGIITMQPENDSIVYTAYYCGHCKPHEIVNNTELKIDTWKSKNGFTGL